MTRPLVIKLGGKALDRPGALGELARDVAGLDRPVVLVHGGGAEVSDWCRRLGLEPRFDQGLRVTDPATLEVAVAILAGLANKRLVAGLRAAGVAAQGVCGVDAGLFDAVPHADAPRLGAVGAIRAVDPTLVREALAAGRLPVVATIGAAPPDLLNINADDAAAALAAALDACGLVLFSDVASLSIAGRPVPRVAADDIAGLLDHPDVTGGMRPKLAAAAAALGGGVPWVRLGLWRGAGTLSDILAGRGDGTGFDNHPVPMEVARAVR